MAAAAAAAVAATAAVASVLSMRWRMTVCPTSGRGGCCGGRGVTGGLRVGERVRESARTAGWSRGTAACPGPAGSVWCRSSWASSWVSPWAAAVWQTPAEEEGRQFEKSEYIFYKKMTSVTSQTAF